ncbi:head-tail connector protein, partial [Klebsiella pneumoniae]|uniref:head-tail connector protein n=1 Tax=Klebsiella pneumoniae TaxID=573 RepID=UPI002731AECD
CRIEPDITYDDSLFTLYIGAASSYVEPWTRRKMYESETSEGYEDDQDSILPGDDVKAAMLLIIGHWYENRETVSVGHAATDIPFSFYSFLQP